MYYLVLTLIDGSLASDLRLFGSPSKAREWAYYNGRRVFACKKRKAFK